MVDLIIKITRRLCGKIFLITIFIISVTFTLLAQNGFWLKGDFHIHTTMSDGDITPAEIAKHAFEDYSLDAIAITDHGGHFFRVNDDFLRTDDKGNVFSIMNYDSLIASEGERFKNCSRTTQLLEKSFPEVIRLRKEYSDKLLIQGVEWNVPGHDHGNVVILSETGDAVSDFNFIFDRNDTLSNWKPELKKQNKNKHENSLRGLEYLKNNYPDESYFIVNHPSRKLQYTISDLRDFNNTAPQIAFGFEGMPGHQKTQGRRCKYDFDLGDKINYHSKTYGGADFMLAKVGGVWDALLGEGRKFWVFTNSDFHRPGEDSWPGEFSKNYIWVEDSSYQSLLNGMRSGKIFISSGDLVTDLNFTVEADGKVTGMGETLDAAAGSEIEIKIRFKGASDKLDHLDIITGDIKGIISPDDSSYNNPVNSTAKILKRFTQSEWIEGEDGLNYISYLLRIDKSQYFRLRGTNLPINTKNETDENGNPLCDILGGENNEKVAWQDLWFYSNPIFVEVTGN